MISRRGLVLLALCVLPVLVYLGFGTYALWQTGWLRRLWWFLPVAWLLTWLLARVWKPTSPLDAEPISGPSHWTPRDRRAADIVRTFQQRVETLQPEQLADPQFYLAQAQELADQLARFYHQDASDPFSALTVPEVMAAMRLAIDDMEEWMLEAVPGSKLLTIRQWRALRSAPQWYRRIQQSAWAATVLLNPVNLARWYTARSLLDPVVSEIQTELLAAIYLRFMRQVGFYLIEMNSGRLRGGAAAYRDAFPRHVRAWATASQPAPIDPAAMPPITVALAGQVSSGKSSLINLLTGQQHARVDLLPATRSVDRYRATLGQPPVELVLLDTPGYGDAGAAEEQLEQIESALVQADVLLLVMDTHVPSREADRLTLQRLAQWYETMPRLKPPPVIAVLTHIDLLSPRLEWSPPYDWREPRTRKAESIQQAVTYIQEVFAQHVKHVVPVCSDSQPGRSWGVLENLLPVLSAALDDARATALLRAYEQQLSAERWAGVVRQLRQSGSRLWQYWSEERLRNPGP